MPVNIKELIDNMRKPHREHRWGLHAKTDFTMAAARTEHIW